MKFLAALLAGTAVFLMVHHYSERILDWFRFQSIGTRDHIVEKLNLMFLEIPPHKILLYLIGASAGSGFVVFLLLLPHLLVGLLAWVVVAFLVWKLPKPIVDWLYARRVKLFVLQMVDALSLMSNGLKSGLSVVQAMGLVSQEMPNPIQQEFNLVLSENKLGVPLEEAFTHLAERVKAEDVEMFVTSINILKETGGNLAETFDTIVTTIRDRIKAEAKISAITAQGINTGIVMLSVPPVLGLYFYLNDPNYMKPMFTTVIGIVISLVIIGLEVLVGFVIMKIVKIDV